MWYDIIWFIVLIAAVILFIAALVAQWYQGMSNLFWILLVLSVVLASISTAVCLYYRGTGRLEGSYCTKRPVTVQTTEEYPLLTTTTSSTQVLTPSGLY